MSLYPGPHAAQLVLFSANPQVVRYSALLAGIVYGFSPSRPLQAQADAHAVRN